MSAVSVGSGELLPLDAARVRYSSVKILKLIPEEKMKDGSVQLVSGGTFPSQRRCADYTAKIMDLDKASVAFFPEWSNFGPLDDSTLAKIHTEVMAHEKEFMVVVLPPVVAERYTLYFMLKEKVGAPNPNILQILGPGEVSIVDCVEGSRFPIKMPGSDALEQLFLTPEARQRTEAHVLGQV